MPERQEGSPPGRRILVADDEPHIRRILATLLEATPYPVDQAEDGARALELLSGPTHYALALMDIMMPELSGLEVLRHLRTLPHRSSLPVIILTAKGQDTDREEAFAHGAAAFITKPFSPRKLLARIHEILGDP